MLEVRRKNVFEDTIECLTKTNWSKDPLVKFTLEVITDA